MKRTLSVLLLFGMRCALSTNTFAANDEATDKVDIAAVAENNSSIAGEYKQYAPFTVDSQEVRLYSEPVMNSEDALTTYADAFELCAEAAEVYGIPADINNSDFVAFAKAYAAMNENGTPAFVEECKDFAVYLDYYENVEINQQILNAISANTRNADWSEIASLMPTTSDSTVAAGETAQEDSTVAETQSSSYDTAEVVAYARTWWNKTNNTDYPYYAEYNGMDTSRNDYNSLDSGRSGQSDPARGWSDCADFVSQCLAAGGVPQIKSGLILPHQKTGNWYYNDDKPSHTWGGASNFYNHWKERVGVASSSADLGVGDAVSIDFGGDGSPDHTVIIVSAESTDSSKHLASHTTDRYMYYYSNGTLNPFTLSYLYGNDWTIYGYEIDEAF